MLTLSAVLPAMMLVAAPSIVRTWRKRFSPPVVVVSSRRYPPFGNSSPSLCLKLKRVGFVLFGVNTSSTSSVWPDDVNVWLVPVGGSLGVGFPVGTGLTS